MQDSIVPHGAESMELEHSPTAVSTAAKLHLDSLPDERIRSARTFATLGTTAAWNQEFS